MSFRDARCQSVLAMLLMTTALLTPTVALAQNQNQTLAPTLNAQSYENSDAWSVHIEDGQQFQRIQDEQFGREVLAVEHKVWSEFRTKEAIKPPYTIEAIVRQPSGESGRYDGIGVLRAGLNEDDSGARAAYTLSFQAPSRGDGATNKGFHTSALRQEKHDEPLPTDGRDEFSARNGEDYRPLRVGPRFTPRHVSPLSPINFRRSVTRDMAAMPYTKDEWQRVRIEVDADGRARLWHSSFVIADYPQPQDATGQVSLRLFGPMQLASLRVYRPAHTQDHFISVPLDGLLNSKDFVDRASLPTGGEHATVGGVPFELSAPNSQGDHIDIGRSVFRYRLKEGYRDHNSPNGTPAPQYLDPARIRFRVPKQPVTRVWVLAAADGEPNSVPVITARFYRNEEGYPLDSEATVPVFTARGDQGEAKRLQVRMENGETGSLWAVPIDINALRLNSEFRDETVYELELTKQLQDFRAFPDPTMYTSYPAGLPSSARVYGLTLETAPFAAISSGDLVGNIYAAEDEVVWNVDLESRSEKPQTVNVKIDVTGPYGEFQKTYTKQAKLGAGESAQVTFKPEVGPRGLYTVNTTLEANGEVQTNENTFVSLPPDTRRADGNNSRFGLYYWGGGHDTHDDQLRNMEILHEIGARTGAAYGHKGKWDIGPTATLLVRHVPDWAREEKVDPEKRAAWQEKIVQKLGKTLEKAPDLKYVSFFAESTVTLRLTHGMPPSGIGEPYYELTEGEKRQMRTFYRTAAAGVEAFKKSYPQIKLNFGHAAPLFAYPFFKHAEAMGFDMKQFESYGLDSPQFERMPERWPRATEPSLMYFSNKLYEEMGLHDQIDQVHTESFFPPSHRLGAGKQGQAQIIVRTAAHAFAWGTDGFISAIGSLYVPADYWGTSHYGSAGLIGPGPEFDPFLAIPAYATMTQMIDLGEYDGWLDTGSRSTYAIRFKGKDGSYVYCVYTIRGERPLTLTADDGATLSVTDQHGNTRGLELNDDNQATITLNPAPVWVKATNGQVSEAKVGTPTYEEAPSEHVKLLEDFENSAWTYTGEEDTDYAENHWDVKRVLAPMTSELIEVDGRDSKVMRVTMTEADESKKLLRRYGVFVPERPITVPGKATSLGIWVNGNSNWKRVIYEIEDAEGEIYQNVGTADAWNCDDIHSWSHTNFDGWRFVTFPLPGNAPGDNYREKNSVWWGHSGGDGDGVVDLPIKVNKIIVSMATHQIYVDEMLPVEDRAIEVDNLVAVYDSDEAMTDAPVKLQRAAAGAYAVEEDTDASWLGNPIARMQEEHKLPAPTITDIRPPEQRRTGRTAIVHVDAPDNAHRIRVYVAVYADGRGAKQVEGWPAHKTNPDDVGGLQPNIPMYFWATYTTEEGESKPSKVRKLILADEFPME